MKVVNLIDTIGVETGMHKYDCAFSELCKKEGVDVNLSSNFKSANTKLVLGNYYKGSDVKRILLLIRDFILLLFYCIQRKKQIFIYQSFGFRIIDIIFFILLFIIRCKAYLLVHDLYELNANNKSDRLKKIKEWLYKKCVKNYICHSKSVESQIKEIRKGLITNIICIPHFEYTYDLSYDVSSIQSEVKSVINNDKINILFFGQVSLTKGIDILLDAYPLLDERFNVIVAGMDKKQLLSSYLQTDRLHFINRYILDDELNFLFNNVQIVVLPYREIYQSGVLETVIHFKKPVVMSCVQSFLEYNAAFPSFGYCYKPNTPEGLAECLNKMDLQHTFYNDLDMNKYKECHSIVPMLKILFKKN